MNGETKFKEIFNTLNDPISMQYAQANVSITMNNVLQGLINLYCELLMTVGGIKCNKYRIIIATQIHT